MNWRHIVFICILSIVVYLCIYFYKMEQYIDDPRFDGLLRERPHGTTYFDHDNQKRAYWYTAEEEAMPFIGPSLQAYGFDIEPNSTYCSISDQKVAELVRGLTGGKRVSAFSCRNVYKNNIDPSVFIIEVWITQHAEAKMYSPVYSLALMSVPNNHDGPFYTLIDKRYIGELREDSLIV